MLGSLIITVFVELSPYDLNNCDGKQLELENRGYIEVDGYPSDSSPSLPPEQLQCIMRFRSAGGFDVEGMGTLKSGVTMELIAGRAGDGRLWVRLRVNE